MPAARPQTEQKTRPEDPKTDQPLIYDDVPVAVRILRVMADIGAVKKDRKVSEGPARFSFRGVDDVMNAAHPAFVKHGVFTMTRTLERLTETRATSRGGTMNVTILHVEIAFYGANGDSITGTVWGEGQDSGDKSTGKAHSMAWKTLLFQTLCIPTEDTPDPDAQNEPAVPVTELTEDQVKNFHDKLAEVDTLTTEPEIVAHMNRAHAALHARPLPQAQFDVLNKAYEETAAKARTKIAEIKAAAQPPQDQAEKQNQDQPPPDQDPA